MRVRISIVLAALALSVLLPGTVGARSVAAAAKAEHDRIVAYWTPARMAAAKPKDFARDAKTGKFSPSAKPGPGVATSRAPRGPATVPSSSARASCSSRPAAATGNARRAWLNDGSTSNGYSVILTAGHCTYDGSEGWSFNVVYIPDYDDAPTATCANTVHGCWTSTRLRSTRTSSRAASGPDAALARRLRLHAHGPRRQVRDGRARRHPEWRGYGLKTSGVSLSDTQWAFGYPAAGRYKGKDLVYCKGPHDQRPERRRARGAWPAT